MRQCQGLVEAGQRLCRVPQQPEGQSGIDSAGNTRSVAHTEHWSTVLVWRVACNSFLQVLAGRRQGAKGEPCPPKSKVGDDIERGGVGTLRQVEQRFPEL